VGVELGKRSKIQSSLILKKRKIGKRKKVPNLDFLKKSEKLRFCQKFEFSLKFAWGCMSRAGGA